MANRGKIEWGVFGKFVFLKVHQKWSNELNTLICLSSVPYGVSMARLPPGVRQGMMMDPNGTVKSAMSGRSRQQRHVAPPPGHGHPPLGARNSGPWQEGFGSVASRSTRHERHVSPSRSHASHVSPARGSQSRGSKPSLVIPRAKVTPSRGYTNTGYHSDTDNDRFSHETQVSVKTRRNIYLE